MRKEGKIKNKERKKLRKRQKRKSESEIKKKRNRMKMTLLGRKRVHPRWRVKKVQTKAKLLWGRRKSDQEIAPLVVRSLKLRNVMALKMSNCWQCAVARADLGNRHHRWVGDHLSSGSALVGNSWADVRMKSWRIYTLQCRCCGENLSPSIRAIGVEIWETTLTSN